MSKSNRKPTGEKKSAKKTGETTPSKKRTKKGALGCSPRCVEADAPESVAAFLEEGAPTHELPGEAPVRGRGDRRRGDRRRRRGGGLMSRRKDYEWPTAGITGPGVWVSTDRLSWQRMPDGLVGVARRQWFESIAWRMCVDVSTAREALDAMKSGVAGLAKIKPAAPKAVTP